MAQSSKPTAEAVIARYIISTRMEVSLGNYILRLEKPKPANIAAIPKMSHLIIIQIYKSLIIIVDLPEIELYRLTK